jgi:hypothetical protein
LVLIGSTVSDLQGGRISGCPIGTANGPYHIGMRYRAAM